MTAITGQWRQAGGRDVVPAMIEAMGARANAFRSDAAPASDLTFAVGHHAARRGADILVHDGFVVAMDGRLDDRGATSGQAACRAVLDLYVARGVDGFHDLKGDYALAIWDPAKSRLVLARDIIGSRPLFYLSNAAGFHFASEEKGLFPVMEQRRVSEERIGEFLLCAPTHLERGFHTGVLRTPPGSAVIVEDGEVRVERFAAITLPEEVVGDAASQAAGLRRHMGEAVRRRVAGETTVDSLLSGGLDSSTVTSLADQNTDADIHTLSLVFDSRPEVSERPFIESVLTRGEFTPHMLDVVDYDPFAGVEEMLVRQDGLVNAPNQPMMAPLLTQARPGGVLLDGHGGDEVISKGMGRIYDLARAGAWLSLWRELHAVSGLYGQSVGKMFMGIYLQFGPGRHKLKSLMDGVRRLTGRPLELEPSPEAETILAAGFRDRLPMADLTMRKSFGRPANGREADLIVLQDPFQVHALEILDRESQAFGVETRCPFWDIDLITYALSLPSRAKLNNGWTRMILREAMVKDLPADVLWRKDKHDFTLHLRDGVSRSPLLSADTLETERASLGRFLDVDAVKRLKARFDADPAAMASESVQTLWRVGMLMIWLRLMARQNVVIEASA